MLLLGLQVCREEDPRGSKMLRCCWIVHGGNAGVAALEKEGGKGVVRPLYGGGARLHDKDGREMAAAWVVHSHGGGVGRRMTRPREEVI